MVHDFVKFPELTNSQMEFYYFDSPHQQITEDFDCKVIKVTDGDTVRVMTNFRDFDFPVRMLNINAPEMSEGGAESKKWLSEQILGKDITVEIEAKQRVGKFGRLLGKLIADGMDMGEQSLNLGQAKVFGSSETFPSLEKELGRAEF